MLVCGKEAKLTSQGFLPYAPASPLTPKKKYETPADLYRGTIHAFWLIYKVSYPDPGVH